MLLVDDIVPDFQAESDLGPVSFYDWMGDHWVILFSHPADFTPVCTTEFSTVIELEEEWALRNTKVLGISVDSVAEHVEWKQDIEFVAGKSASFPIIADVDFRISSLFGTLPATAYDQNGHVRPDSVGLRALFVVGPDKRLKLSMSYPLTVGRNFAEVLRLLDALQTVEVHDIATPADWSLGQDVIVPLSTSDAEAKSRFQDVDRILPYLRMASLDR